MPPRVSKRAVSVEMPWYQKPNVQAAFKWSVLIIGGGWIISRTLVISEREELEVVEKFRSQSVKHEGSELYETIRRSEHNLGKLKQ